MTFRSTLASFFPAPLVRILFVAVPIAVVCFFVSGLHDKHAPGAEMTPEAIGSRLAPIAHVVVPPPAAAAENAAAGATATAAPMTGQAVYTATCSACHGEGIAGAPKLGDKKAWAPRIAAGFNTLVQHAVDGFTGKSGMMPPKGGGSYEPVEVARAVAYMADKAGASFPEPASLGAK